MKRANEECKSKEQHYVKCSGDGDANQESLGERVPRLQEGCG